jgi:hypothetical protein
MLGFGGRRLWVLICREDDRGPPDRGIDGTGGDGEVRTS